MRTVIRVLCSAVAAVFLLDAPEALAQDGLPAEEGEAVAKIAALGGNTQVRVTFVQFYEIGDADLQLLKPLDHLQSLHLRGTDIGDAGLANASLASKHSLISLDLAGTNITDAGLAHLKGIQRLEFLNLHGTQVSDEGLVHLGTLPRLQNLYLGRTRVSGSGLIHLRNCPLLELLELQCDEADKTDLQHLSALANLKYFHLAGHLEDEHMPFLKGCSKLGWLELTRLKITDDGLLHLETLSNLKQLRIVDSKVTDEGIKKLQQALPNCEIRH